MTGPQPRMPAATAPWSEPGSAASVIRAATFVGIIPCSAIETSSTSRKKRCSSVGSLAGEQQVEVLGEARPAHQVAAEVAPAHLDAVGVGLADAADRRRRTYRSACDLRPWRWPSIPATLCTRARERQAAEPAVPGTRRERRGVGPGRCESIRPDRRRRARRRERPHTLRQRLSAPFPAARRSATAGSPYAGSSRPADRYRLVLGAVSGAAGLPGAGRRDHEQPWAYWRKAGLVVREGAGPVTISVPEGWRGRGAIEWGYGNTGGPFSSLRIASCGTDPSVGRAYSGGFVLRTSPACLPLVFRVGDRTQTVRFGLGRRCR